MKNLGTRLLTLDGVSAYTGLAVNLTKHKNKKKYSIRNGLCLGLVTKRHLVLCYISRRRKFSQILLKLIWNRWQWPLRFCCKSFCFSLCLFLSLSPVSHTLSLSFLTQFLYSTTPLSLSPSLSHTFFFFSLHSLILFLPHCQFLHISYLQYVFASL